MKRFGAVIVFAPEITREQAENALQNLAELGVVAKEGWGPTVEEFDDRLGGPVWYLP